MYHRSFAASDSLCHTPPSSALAHAMQDSISSSALARYLVAKTMALDWRESRNKALQSSRVFAFPDPQGTSLPWCRDFARDASNCIPVRPRDNGTASVILCIVAPEHVSSHSSSS